MQISKSNDRWTEVSPRETQTSTWREPIQPSKGTRCSSWRWAWRRTWKAAYRSSQRRYYLSESSPAPSCSRESVDIIPVKSRRLNSKYCCARYVGKTSVQRVRGDTFPSSSDAASTSKTTDWTNLRYWRNAWFSAGLWNSRKRWRFCVRNTRSNIGYILILFLYSTIIIIYLSIIYKLMERFARRQSYFYDTKMTVN